MEKQLPSAIRDEVAQVQSELPARQVPALSVPEGVSLPPVATLPSDVELAIIAAAKNEIRDTAQAVQAPVNLEILAKELDAPIPTLLADNPLYEVKVLSRDIALVTTTSPIDKAQELLKQDN